MVAVEKKRRANRNSFTIRLVDVSFQATIKFPSFPAISFPFPLETTLRGQRKLFLSGKEGKIAGKEKCRWKKTLGET